MFAVVITEKGGAQRRMDFDKNEVTIGRVQGNDIILPKGNVSKRHSRIVLKDNRFIVVDLKSTNGTYVNGRKITSPLVVKGGDKIYIGDFILTLEDGAGGAVSASPPSEPMSPAPVAAAPPMPAPGPPPVSASRPSAPPPLPPPSAGRPPAPPPGPPPLPPPMAGPPMGAPMPPPAMPPPAMPPPAMPPMAGPPPMPPMPGPPMAPPMASAPMPPAAERFPLDEEPPMDQTPQPRAASRDPMPPAPPPMPMAPPAPMPMPPAAPMAPAPMPIAAPMPMSPAPMMPAAPVAAPVAMPTAPRPAAPPPRGARAALAAVVGHASGSFAMHQVTSPAGAADPRRELAKRAVDAATEALTRAGGTFDRNSVGAAALEEMVGLGALAGLIEEQGAQDIIVQGPDTILVDRGSGLAPGEGYFSSAEALTVIVSRLVTMSGGVFDRGSAMHEGTLANGLHFLAALPPVAIGGPMVELRRTFRPGLTGDQLVGRGMLSNDMFEVLRRGSRGRKNVVVVGTSDGGVRQLLSALANLSTEDERLLTIEDVPMLELASPTAVRLAAGPGSTMQSVIAQGGRLRADRLVIDGVRGDEAFAALMQLSARSGCMLGVHSSPGGNALDHLVALARMTGAGDGIGRLIASAVQLVVRVGRGSDGVGRVESIAEVMPDGSGGARVNELFRGFAAVGQPQTF